MKLTHRQIEVFRAVMNAGQVTHAAEALHTSQPTVSRELARLEQVLGIDLFERVRGRLRPTVRAMALDVLTRVRRLGVSACIYDGMNPSKMKAVFSYADRIGAKRVIIIGEREAAARSVNVKHLASRVENTVGLEELQRFVTDP